MSDEDTSTDTGQTDDTAAEANPSAKTFTQADLDRIVSDRVARERAKYADYGDLKKRAAAAMTEQEKAVVEAEQRGRSAALSQSGARLARAEFRATAAGLVDKAALDGFLEYADLSKFVGDDGEPDARAIEAAVKKLGGTERATDFDGGARTPAGKPADMNALIRRHAGVQG